MAEWVEVVEGKARLRMPASERAERGPGSHDASVFFNPAMALNRDLSSLLLATQAKAGWQVLDGMAASGARGLRYALECDAPIQVQWNDWNPVAARLIAENAKANGLIVGEGHHEVTHRSLAPLLHERVWAVVDIDPFGSPIPFLDAASRAVRHNGLLCVTATDTTALAGVYPKVCRRRYDATPMHGELGHEVALRILAGAATRAGARHDIAYTPIFAHATDHYYRVTLRAQRGAGRADKALGRIGVVISCQTCGHRGFEDAHACPACGGGVERAGPLWTGPLVDADVADAMMARADTHPLARPQDSRALLSILHAEARAPGLFHDMHRVGQRLGIGSPPRQAVFDALKAAGHIAAPVHFTRLGVRTDASAAVVADIVRVASAAASSAH